jgi:methylmalonyl-CoA mutase cobalamin-binding domain/chain
MPTIASGRADRRLASSDAIQLLEDAVILADLTTGKRVLNEVVAQHGCEAMAADVLEPVLSLLGARFRRQEVSLAQSYVLAVILEEALDQILRSRASGDCTPFARKGPVVLANIEDDCHPLGRRMISTFLQIRHWDVCDLGIDVEAKTIVHRAMSIGARVIGVSAMSFTTAKSICKVREEINARGLEHRIQLAVGGAVFRFNPDLVTEVRADGTALNAFAALPLFEELCQKAEAWGR